MKLRPAPGGPEMRKALSNHYVQQVTAFLLEVIDQESFTNIALFLSTYTQHTQEYFAEALHDLRDSFQARHDKDEQFPVPASIDEFIQVLDGLYQHDVRLVGFLRGAIVEQLAFRLISQRCRPNECLDNQVFQDERGHDVTKQVDVAVLSRDDYFVEGYECKMRASGTEGLKSEDCSSLANLMRVAHNEGFDVHVGVISFDSDKQVKSRLKHFHASPHIMAYGLESISRLRSIPSYVDPNDFIGNE